LSLGLPEIIIVIVLALLVFGPKRLPQMGKSLGRGVREFKRAADSAKSELGLDEVTNGINDIKSTFTEPVKDVTGTFGDLKKSVDLKSAIEAPAAATGAVAAAGLGASASTPVVTRPGKPLGMAEAGPETPDVTPATVFADVAPAPEAPEPPAETPPADEAGAAPEIPAVTAPAPEAETAPTVPES
jgi:TatA/E family protein of Tat protein translocase